VTLKALVPLALLLLAGCGEKPTPGSMTASAVAADRASPEEMRELWVWNKARRDVVTIAAAAYRFSIEHPDRCPGATLDEILQPDPGSTWEGVRDAAREVAVDPWGNRIRMEFRGPHKIVVAASAGPDGKFETADDLRCSSEAWQ
jgi:hypothetical protein